MKLTNEDWKYRIINASPTRLVIVTYDIILSRIEAACEALNSKDVNSFRENVNSAKEFVIESAASVNMNAPVSADLIDLYLFVNKLLLKAYFSNDGKYLGDAGGIIRKLRDSLANEVDDGIDFSGGAEASGNYTAEHKGGL